MHEIIAYGSFCACYLYYWASAFDKLKDNVTTAYAHRKPNNKQKSRDPLARFIDLPPYDTGRIILSIFGMVRKASIVCVLVYVAAAFGMAASAPLLRVVPTVADAISDVKTLIQGRSVQPTPDDANAAVAQLLSVVVTIPKEKAVAQDTHIQKIIDALAWVMARSANIFISFLATSLIVYSISRMVVPNVKDVQSNGDLMYQYASKILFASGATFLAILFVLESSHDLKPRSG